MTASPTIWAIADLHLSFARPRDQTRYGDRWRDHTARLQEAWRAHIAPQDIVLLPGDLSWGRTPLRVQPDIDWLASMPGSKVLVRGNHDYWWRDLDEVRRTVLRAGMYAVQGDCLALDGILICGTMGHIAPNDPYFQPHKLPSYRRELNWLTSALEHAAVQRTDNQPVILMMHFPPYTSDGQPTGFSEIVRRYAPEVCVYGHLHLQHEWAVAVDGARDGTRYHLVAADYMGMCPRRVWPPQEIPGLESPVLR
jgi:predicted phosphohydrolase